MADQLSFFDNGQSLVFPQNLLEYYPDFLDANESAQLLDRFIRTVPWMQPMIKMYGKKLLTPRLTAWFGDPKSHYSYSGSRFDPMPWTEELASLRTRIQHHTGLSFNSVLLNYYRDGNDSVAWHADNEKELGPKPDIASLSLGQPRSFDFRNKANHQLKYELTLQSGSLLIMRGDLQNYWEHRIPKSNKPMRPRINLTFRTIRAYLS
ncbi:Alkylated DNA repair dioxygenase AlkB [bacterium A37T11]|nr:Alkylated DNA repair dioxygenase AlkB [bacterium A37T11]